MLQAVRGGESQSSRGDFMVIEGSFVMLMPERLQQLPFAVVVTVFTPRSSLAQQWCDGGAGQRWTTTERRDTGGARYLTLA